MELKAVLFDLDGTLLPMDQDLFVKAYLGSFAQKLVSHGYDPKQFIQAVWLGVSAMVQNDGKRYTEIALQSQSSAIVVMGAGNNDAVLSALLKKDLTKR